MEQYTISSPSFLLLSLSGLMGRFVKDGMFRIGMFRILPILSMLTRRVCHGVEGLAYSKCNENMSVQYTMRIALEPEAPKV